MKYKMFYFSTLSLPFAFATGPIAAQTEDGVLDSASTGKADITLEVLDSVQITALNSIDFGNYGGTDSGGLNLGDAFCVYVNGGDQYTITPTSANAGFKLLGSTFGDEIEYTVRFNGAATGANAAAAIPYSVASSSFVGSSFLNCNAMDNASIDLSISEQSLQEASTDTYADTLILLVNPI